MLSLFNALGMRAHLKRLQKSKEIVCVKLDDLVEVYVRVLQCGWFTCRVDSFDADAETWLATEVFAISDIVAIAERTIGHERLKLMSANGDPMPTTAFVGVASGYFDEFDEFDEGDLGDFDGDLDEED